MKNFSLLLVRLVLGGLMAGHGAQKLFGSFSGPGIKGTGGFMEQLGMKPGHVWGPVAALGEFSGGVLTLLGFLHPVGPQNISSAMVVATRRAHWGKPIWAASGGAELAITNLAIATLLIVTGPGKYSLDSLFGIKLPRWVVALTWINPIIFTGSALFRPEVAQTVLDRATGNSSAYTGPADSEPHTETETRPRVTDTADTQERAGI